MSADDPVVGAECFLHVAEVPPQGNSRVWITRRASLVVRLTTRSGVVGLGEAYVDDRLDAARDTLDALRVAVQAFSHVEDAGPTTSRLVGNRPARTSDEAWAAATSALDMAWWEIKARRARVPVWKLWTTSPSRVVPYASGFPYRAAVGEQVHHDVEALAVVVDKGFRFGKLRVGRDLAEDVERVSAVAGTGLLLGIALDANRGYRLDTAARAMAEIELIMDDSAACEYLWFEEPTSDYGEYARLQSGTNTPIAGGEAFVAGQVPVDFEGLDILQPDAGLVGGPTAVRRFETVSDLPVVPHVWGGTIALACGLHLAAATRNPTLPDGGALLEVDVTPNPLRGTVAQFHNDPFEGVLAGGELALPRTEGWGVELDEKQLLSADESWSDWTIDQ